MRAISFISTIAASVTLSMGQYSVADDQLDGPGPKELALEYRKKARTCQQGGDTSCAQACVDAMKLVASGVSPEYEQAAKTCDNGYAPFQERNLLAAEGALLSEGYSWMPDVEATFGDVGRQSNRTQFNVEGRGEDWNKYCNGDLRFGGTFFEDITKLTKTPGAKFLLTHVQYTTETKRTGQCIVGGIKAIR